VATAAPPKRLGAIGQNGRNPSVPPINPGSARKGLTGVRQCTNGASATFAFEATDDAAAARKEQPLRIDLLTRGQGHRTDDDSFSTRRTRQSADGIEHCEQLASRRARHLDLGCES